MAVGLSGWVVTIARSLLGSDGRKAVVDVEQWAEVRRMKRVEGLSAREIGRRTGLARDTVGRLLAAPVPPRYSRVRRGRSWTRLRTGSVSSCKPIRRSLRSGCGSLRWRSAMRAPRPSSMTMSVR